MEKNPHNFCIILAGGIGRRLWPVSRRALPKQFTDFFGSGRTALQTTYDRFAEIVPEENIFVSTTTDYQDIVRTQLPQLPPDHVLAEPVHRGTAPSVAWVARHIHLRCDEATIVVTPSDQLITNETAFRHDVLEGLEFVADRDLVLTMGIRPTRPEPGYGYIQTGEPTVADGVHRVKSFTEKPEREFARMFMESGEFFWNTGLFLSNARNLKAAFKGIFPDLDFRMSDITASFTPGQEQAFVAAHFPAYPHLSMDKAILEKSDNVYVMKCNFGWADLGTWHGIFESQQKWEGDNVVVDSLVELEGCRNCIVRLPKGTLGVIQGLEGYIVAEEKDVLFICKKEDSSSLVRKYQGEVAMKYGEDYS